jgi:hypothetical protein
LRDFAFLSRVLHAYDPAANRIANTVAVVFVEERVIRQQQDAIGELSTPVLPVRERLLVPPIIGVLDGDRADQPSEQMVRGIRTDHAKVRRHQHHRCLGRRRHRREPPGSDRRPVTSEWYERHHYRTPPRSPNRGCLQWI